MIEREFVYPLRVHIDDTDFLGSVYHANYLKFMERARSEWMEELGFGIRWQQANRIAFLVHSLQMRFLKPAALHELVEVASLIKMVRSASLVFDQYLRLAGSPDKIFCIAEIKVACVDSKMQPAAIPEISTFKKIWRANT